MKLRNPHASVTATSALVLGLGASGCAAAELLCGAGVAVTVVDAASGASQQQAAAPLATRGVRVLVGAGGLPDGPFDLCVVSPGVPCHGAWVTEIQARGVETIAELELGARFCQAPMLAITGTNGKSTVTKLCHELLCGNGMAACIGGNYGTPLCRLLVDNPEADWAVLEVSSFQMELTATLRPRVGVFLNLQPDHLDRHGSMAEYLRLKARLFQPMRGSDVAIVHGDEAAAIQALVGDAPRWVTFGLSASADYAYRPGAVVRGNAACVALAGTAFDNPVLGQSAAALAAVGAAVGLEPAAVGEVLRQFVPLAHRVQVVGHCRDVTFVDDSKATNLAALHAALGIVQGPVRLIAGGLLKENDLDSSKEVLARRVVSVYGIGEASRQMDAAWGSCVCFRDCGDLRKAVEAAWADAAAGDVILLSPGCASFDQFKSYKDRGDQFKKLVEGICHAETAS